MRLVVVVHDFLRLRRLLVVLNLIFSEDDCDDY